MGVKGLTTYLQENQRALSGRLCLSASSEPRTLIVDGWSFLYCLYQGSSTLPWVYGGEYEAFAQLVQDVVKAWIKVGFTPHFVWDGPSPKLKHPLQSSRLTNATIAPSILFHRTSSISRSSPRFLLSLSNRIIPPLIYQTCISSLKQLEKEGVNVGNSWADGEADPYCVALAVERNALVASQDSDFLILWKEGFDGYVPLDSMVWTATEALRMNDSIEQEDSDGFQPVRKKIQPAISRGIIPPPSYDSLTLTVYHPSSLSNHLRIPPRLLPLLASLLGNDFTPPKISSRVFNSNLRLTSRITYTAQVISSILNPSKPSLKKKYARAGKSVVSLINTIISEMSTHILGATEQEEYVGAIIDSILQYIVQDPSPLGPFSLVPVPSSSARHDEVRDLYLKSYQEGDFAPELMDVIVTGTMWPQHFLEDPDVESCTRWIGGPVRKWTYAAIENGVGGLGVHDDEEEEEVEEEVAEEMEEEDEDELIDVVEEEGDWDGVEEENAHGLVDLELPEDPLAGLRSVLEKLRLQDKPPALPGDSSTPTTTATIATATSASTTTTDGITGQLDPLIEREEEPLDPAEGSRYILEYVRKGVKCIPIPVKLHALSDLILESQAPVELLPGLPVQFHSIDIRMLVFFHALGSDVPKVWDAGSGWVLIILALRWAIMRSSTVSTSKGGRGDRRWTKTEARAFVRSCFPVLSSSLLLPPPEISTRSIQLTAQILSSLESCEHLSQALLLSERVHNGSRKFRGSLFHALLDEGGKKHVDTSDEETVVWEAVQDGIGEELWKEEWESGRKAKKTKKTKNEALNGIKNTTAPVRSAGGRFSVLELE